VKLNLGSGYLKMDGYVSVDKYVQADIQADLLKLPFKDGEAEEVFLHHVIEHFPIKKITDLLEEIHRVLQPEGVLKVGYPEFEVCVRNFLENTDGRRWSWWAQTLYGSQTAEGMFHTAPIMTDRLVEQLVEVGFKDFDYRLDGADASLQCVKTKPLPWF